MKPCWNRSSPFPSRAGRSRTCLSPRIRRSPRRSASARSERPVREWNPSHLLDRQAVTPASSQGKQERLAGVEPACPPWQSGAWTARPQAHQEEEQQGRKESNPLHAGWSRIAHPGAHPWQSAEGAGLEPARACASSAFQAGAIVSVGSSFRIELSRQGSNLQPSS